MRGPPVRSELDCSFGLRDVLGWASSVPRWPESLVYVQGEPTTVKVCGPTCHYLLKERDRRERRESCLGLGLVGVEIFCGTVKSGRRAVSLCIGSWVKSPHVSTGERAPMVLPRLETIGFHCMQALLAGVSLSGGASPSQCWPHSSTACVCCQC
jgi:hypothetical protein